MKLRRLAHFKSASAPCMQVSNSLHGGSRRTFQPQCASAQALSYSWACHAPGLAHEAWDTLPISEPTQPRRLAPKKHSLCGASKRTLRSHGGRASKHCHILGLVMHSSSRHMNPGIPVKLCLLLNLSSLGSLHILGHVLQPGSQHMKLGKPWTSLNLVGLTSTYPKWG